MVAVESSPQPIHARIYRLIADEIATGALRPGERLPPERSMCRTLGVSRATVRRALGALVQDGLVASSHGRGHFVSTGPLTEPPNALLSFTELGHRRGLSATARVLARRVRPATIEEAESFGIAPGADLFDMRRLRMLDGLPVAVDTSHVPLSRAPRLRTIDFTRASLYDALDEAGCGPVRADYRVFAGGAEPRDAKLLGTAPGAPVLVTDTVAFDREDRLVELARTVYRSDRYRFDSTLVRRREGSYAPNGRKT